MTVKSREGYGLDTQTADGAELDCQFRLCNADDGNGSSIGAHDARTTSSINKN